jgi:3-oxo-5-alpha-steroid 4-dehydrogenase 1
MGFALYEFLAEDGDEAIIGWLWKGLLLVIALSSFLKVPYGKNSYGTGGGLLPRMLLASVTVPPRLGWFVMELPALAFPLLLLFGVGGRYVGVLNPNMVLLGMFILHYVNRVFIFSLTLRGRNTPVTTVLFGIMICSVNGYLQGRYLTNYAHYDMLWFSDPRFMSGTAMFLLGMAINIHSDRVLRSLRAPGETTYKIPHGGMFRYVSGANYFGESLEWMGYAIACWSMVGAYFAIWTVVFLGSRALQYHQFYLDKFEDYPKGRKAFCFVTQQVYACAAHARAYAYAHACACESRAPGAPPLYAY